MADSPAYTAIIASEVDADSPLTASLAFRWSYNPLSVIQGSPTARAAGMGVWVQKSPSGGSFPAGDAQTGIITDCMDTGARLAPDGDGGVIWTTGTLRGMQITSSLLGAAGTTLVDVTPVATNPSYGNVKALSGKGISTSTSSAFVRLFAIVRVNTNNNANFLVKIIRKRGSTHTTVSGRVIDTALGNDSEGTYQLLCWDTSHADGDIYYVQLDSTESDTSFNSYLNGSILELTTLN